MRDIKITVNGKEAMASKGETIFEVASRSGVEIPTLCHDPRLTPYSSCFICVVEVEGMRGLQPSCSTPVEEGMVVYTENKRIATARKTAVDLLVSNHYADCLGPCKQTCPAGVDVQGYVSLIEKGLYRDAISLIKEANPLPAICGRVCVRPCEVACRRNLLDEGAGVGVDYMKRFVADADLDSVDRFMPEKEPPTGKSVAVVGGGPGGLSAAYWLQQKGHQCDVYEAAPKPGGWLRYGIPEYRLPNDVLEREIDGITGLGVNIICDSRIGDNVSFSGIFDKYDAIILAPGSQKGTRLGCDGDDADNVFPGIDFLKEMELTGKRPDFRGKTVAVVGGGNTAMDCCRTSLRCGADRVVVVYRRTEKEMPANPIEIHESKVEGVEYMFLTNPVRVNKDSEGRVKSMTLIRMELGEPDSSGRRRPVEVEGSEFEIEVDYILAAIGQKTDLHFIDDINSASKSGILKANRWGDIDADPGTLRTGIENVFAAGDSVSGPATIIEAIAQARIAVSSCHNYLMGLPVTPAESEFLSVKDNFREQVSTEYSGLFIPQTREEMPVLKPEERMGFDEVELGYNDEQVVKKEADRCLECGCSAFFDCDLQRYATRFGADQKRFLGEFNAFEVDFSHPFVEFDRNKCILCGKCIRMCSEVVGANALGLVNRGFVTHVSPDLDGSLKETRCESCGMCISVCPTAALMDNFKYKPGPIESTPVKLIDMFGSEGCEMILFDRAGFYMGADGSNGLVNPDGNIGRQQHFGYNILNANSRITKPLIREGESFREAEFGEVFDIIRKRAEKAECSDNLFFAGARLTNEELYLIQKSARAGFKSGNVGSFHYMGRGNGYLTSSDSNVPFADLSGADAFFVVGAELTEDNQFTGFILNSARIKEGKKVSLFTTERESSMRHKADKVTVVGSYYHFILAVNHYVVKNKLYNKMFLDDHCGGYDEYLRNIDSLNFDDLVRESGVSEEVVADFAREYTATGRPVLLFSEKCVDSGTSTEICNLSLLAGKRGKTSSGILCLKEKNNSQGLIDMGISSWRLPGNVDINDIKAAALISGKWGVDSIPQPDGDIEELLFQGRFRNIFIFGEDPVGCAVDKEQIAGLLKSSDLLVVQDYFMSETAAIADIVLPSTYPFETGGSYTNTHKFIQQVSRQVDSPVVKDSYAQLALLAEAVGYKLDFELGDITEEIFSIIGREQDDEAFTLRPTDSEGVNPLFVHGADTLNKMFDEFYIREMNIQR